MKLSEVKNFPKALLKGKTLPLYKAFMVSSQEDELKIDTNIALLAVSKEAAIEQMVNEGKMEQLFGEIVDSITEGKNYIISFVVIKLDLKDLLTKDVLDYGDVFFEDDILSITLADKIYKIDVEDDILVNASFDKKDIKRIRCKDIKLKKA